MGIIMQGRERETRRAQCNKKSSEKRQEKEQEEKLRSGYANHESPTRPGTLGSLLLGLVLGTRRNAKHDSPA